MDNSCKHCRDRGLVHTVERGTNFKFTFRCLCKFGTNKLNIHTWSRAYAQKYELEIEYHKRREAEKKALQAKPQESKLNQIIEDIQPIKS